MAQRTTGLATPSQSAARPPSSVPIALFHGGDADLVEPTWDLSRRPDVMQREYPFSGHLPFIDNREECLSDVLDFLDTVDGVRSPRRGLSSLESFSAGGRRSTR